MLTFLDLAVSIGAIIVTCGISQFLRNKIQHTFQKETLARTGFLEFVATFELTAVAYESSVVFHHSGVAGFALVLFCVWYWRICNWREVSSSPCTFITEWLHRKIGVIQVTVAILAQLAGGLMTYRHYTMRYWSLGLTETHSARSSLRFDDCQSHIQATPLVAALVEALGTVLYIVLTGFIVRTKFLSRVAGMINAAIGTSLVVLALSYSGGYFSPVLATSAQFGCTGATIMEHVNVYWVAPTVGSLLGSYVESVLVSETQTRKQK